VLSPVSVAVRWAAVEKDRAGAHGSSHTNQFERELRHNIVLSEQIKRKLLQVFTHITTLADSDDRRVLLEVCRRVLAETERCPEAADRLQLYLLSWVARNLLELTFITEFVCGGPENITQFRKAAYRDDVDLIRRMEAINTTLEKGPTPEFLNVRRQESEAKAGRRMKAREFAAAVNREAELDEYNQVFSKLAHPTAWSIIGELPSDANWAYYNHWLLIHANKFALRCLKMLAEKAQFSD
jgi:hypothetical protein